jgi:hypothetical protein
MPRSDCAISVRCKGAGYPFLFSLFVERKRLNSIASAKLNIAHEEKVEVRILLFGAIRCGESRFHVCLVGFDSLVIVAGACELFSVL